MDVADRLIERCVITRRDLGFVVSLATVIALMVITLSKPLVGEQARSGPAPSVVRIGNTEVGLV